MISANSHGFTSFGKFFQEFQSLVEQLLNRKIPVVQSDWGGEYERLSSCFSSVGIAHHISCPHAHQQNGVAEHKHQHIIEVGLALLANTSLPLKFWDQYFLTATHLINRTPSKKLDYDTPLHRLLGATMDYTNLHVFGCACWPNLRLYASHKLQYRPTRCIFLGYSNIHKGYKCLDPTSGRVYISRDVVFDESLFPFANLHNNAGARYTSEVLLLLEPTQSQANSELPMNNDPHVSCLPCHILFPPQVP
jgi:hypothetical protein